VNEKNVPNHVAIILDGNGRWAKKKEAKRDLMAIIWVAEIYFQ
jgi:undecaprenyl pyrophosphate synthase